MYKTEPFLPEDIFSLDLVNLDSTTDNYSFSYYLHYHMNHSDQMYIVRTEDINSSFFIHTKIIVGYIIGKEENQVHKHYFRPNTENRSMHISAISIAPSHRSNGIATQLCKILENDIPDILYVDLFVRTSNEKAITFYERNGYVRYRRIFKYYTFPAEDAWDMRKFIKEKHSKGTDIHAEMLF